MTTGSALPTLPQSVPRGRSISWLHWFASATACQVACPPVRIRPERPAFGDFYFQAFDGSVSLPVAGYNYNSDLTPLLAGHPPPGKAASFAARPSSTFRTAEVILRAVNDTKDNDSIGAIVGAAVGALHGDKRLPDRWKRGLLGRTQESDDGRIFEIIDEAIQRFGQVS